MNEVLRLSESRIKCLRRLSEFSERFLVFARSGSLSEASKYSNFREVSLRALEHYNQKIQERINQNRHEFATGAIKNILIAQINEEKKLIQDIIKMDEELFGLIETEKDRLKKSLAGSQKSITITSKFKSIWVTSSGEELDQQI